MTDQVSNAVRVHLTNVAGAGASQLLQSLLPALEADAGHYISDIYLPNRGLLARYRPSNPATHAKIYRRYVPNAISRLLECILFGHRFDDRSPLLVLGDLPLRSRSRQTVFVQTSHLLRPSALIWSMDAIKFGLLRAVFKFNLRYVKNCIVQTSAMRDALVSSYPALAGRVYVIPQPVPIWLLKAGLKRSGRADGSTEKLKLIYPAAGYPHKNHRLLAGITKNTANDWPVESLQLTIEPQTNPAPDVRWISCSGFLSAPEMIDIYRGADALLFLSCDESYGFPLVEAMYVGLPIVCPNLPYARVLCGDEAIYFDQTDLASLQAAISILQRRLVDGWWPDWREQLAAIPADWDSTARQMLAVVDATGWNFSPS